MISTAGVVQRYAIWFRRYARTPETERFYVASLTADQEVALSALATAANDVARRAKTGWEIEAKTMSEACADFWEETLENHLASEYPAGFHTEADLMAYFGHADVVDDAGEVTFTELRGEIMRESARVAAKAGLDHAEVKRAFRGLGRVRLESVYSNALAQAVMSS